MRSINTQKVFGCRSRQLRINLIAEAVCLTAVSFLLAVLTVHALEETNLSSLITGGISPGDYPGLISISAGNRTADRFYRRNLSRFLHYILATRPGAEGDVLRLPAG